MDKTRLSVSLSLASGIYEVFQSLVVAPAYEVSLVGENSVKPPVLVGRTVESQLTFYSTFALLENMYFMNFRSGAVVSGTQMQRLVVRGCHFDHNEISRAGGAALQFDGFVAIFEDTTFSNNTAVAYAPEDVISGGAVVLAMRLNDHSAVSFTDCSFERTKSRC